MYTSKYIYSLVHVKLMPRGEFDRSARKAETRARLLDAAARVYARRGFNGATLDEVAAEAGFTKGAVYGHFGSKENLLLALMDEHLARQVAEQVALFDRERITWERPLAGSASWMQDIEQEPDALRLFVELWTYAQRDERLREHLQTGLEVSRATFARFATASAADAGAELTQTAAAQFGNVVVGLGMGLAMMKLIDPEHVSASLLGTALSMLIRAAESDPQMRELLDDPDRSQAAEVGHAG